MHPWEASPYANVHKYNHDVLPANAALGVNGCTDCHHPESDFALALVVSGTLLSVVRHVGLMAFRPRTDNG